MKEIVIVNHSFPPIIGGGQTHQYYLAKFLPEYGYNTNIITGELPEHYADREIPTISGSILRVKGFKEYSKGRLGITPFYEEFMSAMAQTNPDIIFTHGFMSQLLVDHLRFALPKTKIAFMYHTTPIPNQGKYIGLFKNPNIDQAIAKYVIQNTKYDVLIGQNKYYSDFVREMGVSSHKLKTINLGVDRTLFNTDTTNAIHSKNDAHINLLLPVRLSPRKGIEQALGAMNILPKQYRLTLATSYDDASPEYIQYIRNQIQMLEIDSRITILNNQFNFLEMASLYKSCDITLMPSSTEGFGLGTIESMACGIPVIGANSAGTQEIIVHQKNGLLFTPNNPNDLAEQIISLENAALKEKIIQNALLTVSKKYDIIKHIQKLTKIFDQLTN